MIKYENTSIEVEKIVDFLKKEMLLREFCQKILSQKIISEAAQQKEITVSSEEVQAEAEKIRREKRLEKASDTLAWLEENMLTSDEWEVAIINQLLAQKLAKHLFDKEVERFFAENRLNFDRFVIYQIIVSNEQIANEIIYQIEEEEISFYQAAHLYDIDEKRRDQCGYEGKLYRWDINPSIATVLLSQPVGELVGPLKTEQGYHILTIEKFIPAELNSQTRQEIINSLFAKWLEGELSYLLYNKND